MAEPQDEASDRFILDPPESSVSGAVRYGVSALLVALLAVALAVWTGHAVPDEAAADIDNAVTVDLPPAEASSQPASDAAQGPEQEAAEAAAAQPAPPEPVEPPKPETPPDTVAAPVPTPAEPPPVLPNPAAVIEPPKETTPPPPPPVAAPPMPTQEALAPPGSERPTRTDAEDDEEGRPAPSSHAITLWQKSLMRRLEAAKREVGRKHHIEGTVKVAFEIDARGALAGEHVAQSSGSPALDRAAMLLIRRAAPFPAPPANAAGRDTSFVVPVRFR